LELAAKYYTKMKFKKVKKGEWQMPIMRAYKMACCDCGLVHSMHFMVIDPKTGKKLPGRVIMKGYRDEVNTKKLRKKK
jgi:hypothetical protein